MANFSSFSGGPACHAHVFVCVCVSIVCTRTHSGLGDSNYSKFNRAAKDLDALLHARGAARFLDTALADDATGLEATIEPWRLQLAAAVEAEQRQHAKQQEQQQRQQQQQQQEQQQQPVLEVQQVQQEKLTQHATTTSAEGVAPLVASASVATSTSASTDAVPGHPLAPSSASAAVVPEAGDISPMQTAPIVASVPSDTASAASVTTAATTPTTAAAPKGVNRVGMAKALKAAKASAEAASGSGADSSSGAGAIACKPAPLRASAVEVCWLDKATTVPTLSSSSTSSPVTATAAATTSSVSDGCSVADVWWRWSGAACSGVENSLRGYAPDMPFMVRWVGSFFVRQN
jgi:hypothetical protein